MCCHMKSHAVLQHALQLLVVLVFHWRQQHQEALRPVAALSLYRRSPPSIDGRVFLETATANVSLGSSCRGNPPSGAAEAHVSARQCSNGRAIPAGEELLGCYTSSAPAAAAGFTRALKSGALAAATAAADDSLLSSKGTRPEGRVDLQHTYRRGKSISAKHAIELRATTSPLDAYKASCEKLKRAAASAGACSHCVLRCLSNLRKNCLSEVSRPEDASRHSESVGAALGASGRGLSLPSPASTTMRISARRKQAYIPAAIIPHVTSSVVNIRTARTSSTFVRCSFSPYTQERELFGYSPLCRRRTAPFTAKIESLAVVLSSRIITPQSQGLSRRHRRFASELLQLLLHPEESESSKSRSSSGSRLGPSGRARPRQICCSLCPASTRTTEDAFSSAVTASPPAPVSPSPRPYAAAAARRHTAGRGGRTGTASAATCRTINCVTSSKGVSAAPTAAEETLIKTVDLNKTSRGRAVVSPRADKSTGFEAVDSLLQQRSVIALLRTFNSIFQKSILLSKPICPSHASGEKGSDSAAASTFGAAGETPRTPLTAAREAAQAALLLSAASAAVRSTYTKFMLSLTGACQAARAVAMPLNRCNLPEATAKDSRPRAATRETQVKKATAAATSFCRLPYAAFLGAQSLQRRRRCGTTVKAGGKAAEDEALAGVGMKGCGGEQNSTRGRQRYEEDPDKIEETLSCKQVSSFAEAEKVVTKQKCLAWLSWRKKKKRNDEGAQGHKNENDKRTADSTSDSAEDIFGEADKDKELLDKASDEARRQAFRSPVVSTLLRLWEETPKFTRLYLSGAFTLSLLSFMYGQSYPGIFSPSALLFDSNAIRKKKQFYRLITSLFFFGPLSIPTLLSLSFVHAYLGGLEQHFQRLEESSSSAASYSFSSLRRLPLSRRSLLSFVSPFSPHHMFSRLLLSSAAAAMTLAALKQIPNEHLLQCISTSLLHVWSRLFPSGEADFYGLFAVSNEFLPFFFLAQNWLLEGRIVAADLYGVGIAALWLLLIQQKVEEQQEKLQREEQPGQRPEQQPQQQ